MDGLDPSRSYVKKDIEDTSYVKGDRAGDEEDWESSDKRKHQSGKSRKHSNEEETEEWDSGGKGRVPGTDLRAGKGRGAQARRIVVMKMIMTQERKVADGVEGGGYVLLSNLYASFGRWDKVARVRKIMNERKVELNPGWSWIEIDGTVHKFLAADRLHPQITEIHEKLNQVLKRASIEGGYVANTKQALFDLSEEEKEQAVSWHSEKLAVAFGLMSTEPRTPIRIVKNLRICEDCHSKMKAISQVFSREIVVRDRS